MDDWAAHDERSRISHDGDSIDSLGEDCMVHVVDWSRVDVTWRSFSTAIAETSDAGAAAASLRSGARL